MVKLCEYRIGGHDRCTKLGEHYDHKLRKYLCTKHMNELIKQREQK